MRICPHRLAALAGALLIPALAGAQDAYVPNQGSDDLTIFDTQDPLDRVFRPLGNQPHEGIATRDARYVFISNRLDDTLSVFDTVTRSEIDVDDNPLNGLTRIIVGIQPHGLALTPDDRFLFVANDGSHDLTVVDVDALQVVSTVPGVGSFPHMVAITPDGREAWTGNVGGGDVSIVDVAAAIAEPLNAVVCVTPGGVGSQCRIPAGAGTEGIAFTHDGSTAYAANGGANTITVIDVASRTVVRNLPVAGSPRRVHLTPDGRRAYISQLFGTDLVAIDTETHEIVPEDGISGVQQVLGMDFAADGSLLYAANFFSSTITTVQMADTSQRTTVAVGANPDSVILLPEEVRGLRFGMDGATLSWEENVLATGYRVYRGSVALLPDYGSCLLEVTGSPPAPEAVDPKDPALGAAFLYLITLDLGNHEGIAGRARDGTLREPSGPCPSAATWEPPVASLAATVLAGGVLPATTAGAQGPGQLLSLRARSDCGGHRQSTPL